MLQTPCHGEDLAIGRNSFTLVPAYPLSTNDFKSKVMLPVKGLFAGRSPSQMLDDSFSNSGLGESEPQHLIPLYSMQYIGSPYAP